jgi:predicted ester cyclase
MSTSDNNKAIVCRIPEELYNHGKLEVADEVFADGYVEHHPLPPHFPSGREAVKRFVTGARTAFTDLHYSVESAIGEGDMIGMRITARGTHTGAWELLPIPPSGKSATWTEMHFCRIANGQVVEHWAVVHQLSLMQQLGAPA